MNRNRVFVLALGLIATTSVTSVPAQEQDAKQLQAKQRATRVISGKWGHLSRPSRATYATWDGGIAFVVWTGWSCAGGGICRTSVLGELEWFQFHKHPSDGKQFAWQAKTTDGSTGSITVGDREYALENGSILLVRRDGDTFAVRQITCDTRSMKPADESLIELSKHDEIAAFFARCTD